MLLLGLGIFSNPSFQLRSSGSQAKDFHPNCRPILSDETRSGFENPFSSRWRMDGNAMGSQQDEPTWEIPFLNSVSGTGQGTDASRFWRSSKPTLLVQKAANIAVSLFSGKFIVQIPFAEFFLQDCEKEQQSVLAPRVLGNQQISGASVQQNDTPADPVQTQNDMKTAAEPGKSVEGPRPSQNVRGHSHSQRGGQPAFRTWP